MPQTLSSSILYDNFDLNITYSEVFPQDGFLYSLNTSSKSIRITVNNFSNLDYEFIYENTVLFKRIREVPSQKIPSPGSRSPC